MVIVDPLDRGCTWYISVDEDEDSTTVALHLNENIDESIEQVCRWLANQCAALTQVSLQSRYRAGIKRSPITREYRRICRGVAGSERDSRCEVTLLLGLFEECLNCRFSRFVGRSFPSVPATLDSGEHQLSRYLEMSSPL